MKPWLAAFFFVPLGATHAQAQSDAPVDAGQVAARVESEHRCVEEVRAELGRWSTLLTDAKRQLQNAATPALRTEAAESIVVLEARIRAAGASLAACVPPEPAAPTVATEPAEPRFVSLGESLQGDTPTFSGHGRLDAASVHRGLIAFGRAFDVCYDALAGRHAIVRGTAALRFEVRADGSVGARDLLRFDLGDELFRRCVRDALPRIGPFGRPGGGAMTVDVMLLLGPEG